MNFTRRLGVCLLDFKQTINSEGQISMENRPSAVEGAKRDFESLVQAEEESEDYKSYDVALLKRMDTENKCVRPEKDVPTSPAVLRKSSRLKVSIDFSEKALYSKALTAAIQENLKTENSMKSEDSDFEMKVSKKRVKPSAPNQSNPKKRIVKTHDENPKKELSTYEQMIQKNREEKMAFLQSLKIEEARLDLLKTIKGTKKKRVLQEKKPLPPPPVLRKKVSVDLSEKAMYSKALEAATEIPKKEVMVIPEVVSFKDGFNNDTSYESYVANISIEESKHSTKQQFIAYEKSDLRNLTLSESNILSILPKHMTGLTWYPSPEQLIVASSNIYGNIGVWNVSKESSAYSMKIHHESVTNLQFSPFNETHLISSSSDGTLRCGDMVQHEFTKIYASKNRCTYFDIFSESTFLVAESNGHVAVIDRRIGNRFVKQACHENPVKTVNIHPVNRNIFLSADSKLIRIWDLRKLQNIYGSYSRAQTKDKIGSVRFAFFSPVTGRSILATCEDKKTRMFDYSDSRKIELKKVWVSGRKCKAIWLPYSEEFFMIGSGEFPRKIKVYDKNMKFAFDIMHEHFQALPFMNAFHPRRHALASGIGKIHVFT